MILSFSKQTWQNFNSHHLKKINTAFLATLFQITDGVSCTIWKSYIQFTRLVTPTNHCFSILSTLIFVYRVSQFTFNIPTPLGINKTNTENGFRNSLFIIDIYLFIIEWCPVNIEYRCLLDSDVHVSITKPPVSTSVTIFV